MAIPSRIAYILALTILFLAGCNSNRDSTMDLFIVAGQSNAVGFDAPGNQLPLDAADGGVMFWWRCGDPPPDQYDTSSQGKWTHLQPQPQGTPLKDGKTPRQYGNFRDASGGFGPEMGFARELSQQGHTPFAVVKVAFSGTGLAIDWNPRDPGPSGACYRALITELNAAMTAARSQGKVLRPRAMIWVQGESDANAQHADQYTQNFLQMIAALRGDLKTPDLAGLLGVNTHFGGGKNAFMPRIVQAQKAVAARDSLCRYVDTEDLPIANAAHFNAEGTLQMGRRFARQWLQMDGGVVRN